VRRQSGAPTALWIPFRIDVEQFIQSGVALRLPPHSKLGRYRIFVLFGIPLALDPFREQFGTS